MPPSGKLSPCHKLIKSHTGEWKKKGTHTHTQTDTSRVDKHPVHLTKSLTHAEDLVDGCRTKVCYGPCDSV